MITIQTTRIHEYYHGISFLGFFPFHMFIDRFVCWTGGRTQVLLSIPFIIPIVGIFAQIFNKKERKKIRFNITFIEYMNFIFIYFVCVHDGGIYTNWYRKLNCSGSFSLSIYWMSCYLKFYYYFIHRFCQYNLFFFIRWTFFCSPFYPHFLACI